MIIGPTIIAKIGPTAATTTAAAVPINAVTITNVSLNTSGMNLLSSNTQCYSKASNARYDITRQLGIAWHRIEHTPLTPACMDLRVWTCKTHPFNCSVRSGVPAHRHGQGTYPRIEGNPARIIVKRLLNDENVSCKFNIWSEKGLL